LKSAKDGREEKGWEKKKGEGSLISDAGGGENRFNDGKRGPECLVHIHEVVEGERGKEAGQIGCIFKGGKGLAAGRKGRKK